MRFTPLLSCAETSERLPLHELAITAMRLQRKRPRLFGGETNRASLRLKLAMRGPLNATQATVLSRGTHLCRTRNRSTCEDAMHGGYQLQAIAIESCAM